MSLGELIELLKFGGLWVKKESNGEWGHSDKLEETLQVKVVFLPSLKRPPLH